MFQAESVQQICNGAWVALAKAEGVDPGRYRSSHLSTRLRGDSASCVLHLAGEGRDDLYFKTFFGADAQDRLARAVSAYRAASRALGDEPTCRAPRVLTYSEEHASFLMACAPGRTAQSLFAELSDDPVARTHILARCGAWLATFHRNGRADPRPFPGFADAVGPRMQMAAAGHDLAGVADGDEFLENVRSLRALADQLAASLQPVCLLHGDFHANNLLIAPDTAYGIDFEYGVPGPAMADIAAFLVTYGADFEAGVCLAPGYPVSRMALDAFLDAYGTWPDPALIRFYAMKSALQKWLAVSPIASQRSAFGQARYAGLRRIAAHLRTDALSMPIRPIPAGQVAHPL